MRNACAAAVWVGLWVFTPAFATTGSVTTLDGQLVTAGPPERVLKAGDALAAGEALLLRKGKFALVTLDDGTLIKLKPGTEFTLGREATASVDLHKGGLFAKIQKAKSKSAGSKFFVRTPSAIMGVRGTEFFTSTAEDKKVWMCVHEGQVEVSKTQGNKNTVLVQAGEGIVVEPQAKIAPPKTYEWTRELNWNMDPQAGDVEDHSKTDYGNLLRHNYD